MILAADIGNTTVGIALIHDDEIILSEKLITDVSEIEVDYREKISGILAVKNIPSIDGAVISSVVPLMTGIINNAIQSLYGVNPIIIGCDTAFGITLAVDEPSKVGSDRIADAVGAVHEYGAPLIIIDMGTATTISAVNGNREFLGGMILPGVRTALGSLITNSAQLPRVKLSSPPSSLIGKNTLESIESGIIYGTASGIDGICDMISEELGSKPSIVATGGNSGKIVPYCRHSIIMDKYLLFKGLNIIYKCSVSNRL